MKNTTNRNESKRSFDELKKAVENAVNNNGEKWADSPAVHDLAQACTLSVLKRILTVATYSQKLIEQYRQLAAFYRDNSDLVQWSFLFILEEVDAFHKRGERIFDFEKSYIGEKPKKRVYLMGEKPEMVKCEIIPIVNIHRKIRAVIDNEKHLGANGRGTYVYLDDLIEREDGTQETIYYRLPHYADLGGETVDFNGKPFAYTADTATVTRFYALFNSLDLNKEQRLFVKYALQGLGLEGIGKRFGISKGAAYARRKTIQNIALRHGLTPDFLEN